jgi:CreA protein
LAALLLPLAVAKAEDIGSVNTTFKVLGPDNKIVVQVFDDPDIDGVACYLSAARTGGIKGGLGLAEDTSDASIACRQVGPITVKKKFDPGDEVFSERRSALFKRLRVVRFLDQKRNALVYLAYSDKLVDGSPKNSVSAVPIMPWPTQTAGK